jgi:hypothetical protein
MAPTFSEVGASENPGAVHIARSKRKRNDPEKSPWAFGAVLARKRKLAMSFVWKHSVLLRLPGHLIVRMMLALTLVAATGGLSAGAAESGTDIPAPALDPPQAPNGKLQTAVLAGGCFWGVQAVFQHVRGVESAVSGSSGGDQAAAWVPDALGMPSP